MTVRMENLAARKLNYKMSSNGNNRAPYPGGVKAPMATQQTIRGQWAHQQSYTYPKYSAQYQNTNNYTASSTNSYGNHRVPTASSPGNISNTSANSNCSSQTGSQSGGGGGTVSGGSGLSTSGQGVAGGPVAVAANGSGGGGAMAGCGGSGGSNASASGSCSGGEQLSKTNLYIRGLNPSTTDKDLVSMCSSFGTITSTKAILDKTTNKCKGYGFVDFENPSAAEGAVKALQLKNIQAQMAKVGIQYLHRRQNTQQEQDPTNLYISNLPAHFKESDVDGLLAKYGQVISTRILRHINGNSKGVGFARMESKEKCEQIIQIFNGQLLQGSEEPLLVKFADGGNKKKNLYKNNDNKMWRDGNDGLASVGGFDPNTLAQNGVTPQHMMPATLNSYNRHYSQLDMLQMAQAYSVPNTQWLPPYMIPGSAAAAAASIPQVDDYSMGVSHMASHMAAAAAAAAAYKNDGSAAAAQAARSISVVMPSPDGTGVPYNAHVIPQLATQMSAMQLGSSAAYMAYPTYYPTASQFIHMPVGGGGGGGGGDPSDHHTPNAGSPEDHFPYAPQPQGGPK